MIDSADDINKAIATTLINFGYKVNGATDVYPRVEIISVEAEEGLEKDNDDEYVNATIEILGKSDRKSTRLNSSHSAKSRMPSSA